MQLLKNENVLLAEYLPKFLPHRENQIKQLADNLLPASKGRSPQNTFIYGPPGNGKTSIARAIGSMILRESIYIPYAIFIEGQVVKLYDSVNHEIIPEREVTETGTGSLKTGMRRDPRWDELLSVINR